MERTGIPWNRLILPEKSLKSSVILMWIVSRNWQENYMISRIPVCLIFSLSNSEQVSDISVCVVVSKNILTVFAFTMYYEDFS